MNSNHKFVIYSFVLMSGMAALVWEVLWQVKSSLALGVSAWGAALTLAITMGGMSIGALSMGQFLNGRAIKRPERIYSLLEWTIGVSGFFLGYAFHLIENIDGWFFTQFPQSPAAIYILGIIAIIGIPTIAMGATLPVLGLISQRWKTSIAMIYGLNTLGAAAGTMLAAFVFIPAFGISHTIWIIALLNLVVGALAWVLGYRESSISLTSKKISLVTTTSFKTAAIIVFVTGFSTFALEVSWFRSLRAAFMSTTEAFAIMLACVLVALGTGSTLVTDLRKSKSLGVLLGWAGVFILVATPVIERFDLFVPIESSHPTLLFARWFMMTLCVVGVPVLLLGVALPWLLDEQDTPRKWSLLYGINTFAAIIGSIGAGWILLPSFGFAPTAWIAGMLVAVTGLWFAPLGQRKALSVCAVIALIIAVSMQSGAGRLRVLGAYRFDSSEKPIVMKSYEGPDSSISVVKYKDDHHVLFIDGFIATQQAKSGFMGDHTHYMAWMGHLPMIAHPDPKKALVICFGTGQTANAVRQENPVSLDIVDINQHVFDLADYFPSNENVLNDKRVHATVMDGRAFLRRHATIYDVITLEPMPPNFAGVNALYSHEFYKLARERLSKNGMIAQWLPFHLITPEDAASISKTFQDVFPNSILWIDPPSKTGILLGTKNDVDDLGIKWPGYARGKDGRNLSKQQVIAATILNRRKLAEYARDGQIITDDNQLLSYGKAAHTIRNFNIRGHHKIMEQFNKQKKSVK